MEAIGHVLRRVSRADIREGPFPHAIVDQFLPIDLHASIAASLPSWDDLRVLAASGADLAGYHRRASARVTPETTPGPAWARLRRTLTHPLVVKSLSERFGNASWPEPRADLRVDCDLAQAAMTPHTDSPGKLLTCLIYLDAGPDLADQGTHLCVLRDDASIDGDDDYRHHNPQLFSVVDEVEFRPNRALIFSRSDFSFHRYGPVSPACAPRYTLNLHLKRPEDVDT